MTIGCSYFGVRIVRHVARDMADLAARGFTAVLHTFSENDLAFYRGTMKEIVETSHAAGLEVQLGPWGVGGTFGGEADSRFVAEHREDCQLVEDGRSLAAACVNRPRYREFVKTWADAALETGADRIFWDEPHWNKRVCRCDACAERFGGPLPDERTTEVDAFREQSLVDFLRELVGHVASRAGRSTVCLLPFVDGPHGISDWDAVASVPGLDTLATDPYWKGWGEPVEPFVSRFAQLVAETAARHGVASELWVPSFGLDRSDLDDLRAAVGTARSAGVDGLWTWGYEACAHMTSLATPDSPLVWEAVCEALLGTRSERRARDLADLDLRSTREIVSVVLGGSHDAAAAALDSAGALAALVDDIAARIERGGRLVYVGAGTSGAIAELDAAEWEGTFAAGEHVVALSAGGTDEDDSDLGRASVERAGVSERDVVVGVSASGSTPYVIAAVKEARRRGAATGCVVCTTGSQLGRLADREVVADVGPEVVSGSTRLKAGTAQKAVLDALSTATMIKLGATLGDLMVSVRPENDKLRARARRTVELATSASAGEVEDAMRAAGGDPKVAIVSLLGEVDAGTARERLAAARGVVRRALEESR